MVELCGQTSLLLERDERSNRRIVRLDRGEIRVVVERLAVVGFALPRLGRLNTGGNDFRSHSKLNLRIDHLPNCVAGATRTWIKAMDNVKNVHRKKRFRMESFDRDC